MMVKDEWISVYEKLPNKSGKYLVYSEWWYAGFHSQNISIARFATDLHKLDEYDFPSSYSKTPGFYDFNLEDGQYYELSDITYWMPLPIPPRGI